jgi:hypothetical protein
VSKRERKIVVVAVIPAPVELVWHRSQDPVQHVQWDIRFTRIAYLGQKDERGYALMQYRTDVAFGLEVKGIGRYLHSTPLRHSTFEFDSDDWKSIIKDGRGIWLYAERPGGTYFKTVYDYQRRHGALGQVLDWILFRRLLQLATEWSFETLRLWCAGDEHACARRRSRLRFLAFFAWRVVGLPPTQGSARSWLGSGRELQFADHRSEAEEVSRTR